MPLTSSKADEFRRRAAECEQLADGVSDELAGEYRAMADQWRRMAGYVDWLHAEGLRFRELARGPKRASAGTRAGRRPAPTDVLPGVSIRTELFRRGLHMRRSEVYRERAEHCMMQAERCSDEADKVQWLRLALSWMRVAPGEPSQDSVPGADDPARSGTTTEH
jgi:hypothetical protein